MSDAGHVPLTVGSTFARYEVVRCIGVGGMGTVFEATHTLLKKRVALKALHANLSRSENGRERFLREAETVARIRHPNVVDITDVGVEGGVPYFVMEFLEGEDVASLLDRGPLEPAVAADIVVPIVSGLCAVHRLGIVHRDIKPENIFLSRDNHGEVVPKLVDFGVSKDIGATLGAGAPPLHTVTGTPHYMSPEQARGSAALDARTDQYALGVLLYQCLSGVRPYEAESLLELMHMIDLGEFRPLRFLLPDLPASLESVVHRAMARHPKDRFESTDAFGRALLPFASARTRYTHDRDFSGQGPSAASSLSQKDAELHASLSANTMPVEAFEKALAQVPNKSSSGVRVRHELLQGDNAAGEVPVITVSGTAEEARSKRMLWLALGSALFLVVLMAGWSAWRAFQPASSSSEPNVGAVVAPAVAPQAAPVKAEAPAEGPVVPAAQVPAAPTPEPSAAPSPVEPLPTRAAGHRRKPRVSKASEPTAPKPAPAPGPSDIQLSR